MVAFLKRQNVSQNTIFRQIPQSTVRHLAGAVSDGEIEVRISVRTGNVSRDLVARGGAEDDVFGNRDCGRV